MIDTVKNRKRAKISFKKETWIQGLKNIQESSTSSDAIPQGKIKNKLDFLKQKWKEQKMLDEKLSRWGQDETMQLFVTEPE